MQQCDVKYIRVILDTYRDTNDKIACVYTCIWPCSFIDWQPGIVNYTNTIHQTSLPWRKFTCLTLISKFSLSFFNCDLKMGSIFAFVISSLRVFYWGLGVTDLYHAQFILIQILIILINVLHVNKHKILAFNIWLWGLTDSNGLSNCDARVGRTATTYLQLISKIYIILTNFGLILLIFLCFINLIA